MELSRGEPIDMADILTCLNRKSTGVIYKADDGCSSFRYFQIQGHADIPPLAAVTIQKSAVKKAHYQVSSRVTYKMPSWSNIQLNFESSKYNP